MHEVLKRVAGRILIPLTKWYLRKPRAYHFENVSLKIFPGVFHPGLFSSTLFLIGTLKKHDLKAKRLLELGCGSGLISIFAARLGARVVASDISPNAVANTKFNSRENGVQPEVILSDIFENIPKTSFDWIVINPPYYAREIKNDEEYAWNCGPNFEYYHRLFDQLPGYLHEDTFVLMVLTKGCDLESIFSIASAKGFSMPMIEEKDVLFDQKDFLFRVTLNSFVKSPA